MVKMQASKAKIPFMGFRMAVSYNIKNGIEATFDQKKKE